MQGAFQDRVMEKMELAGGLRKGDRVRSLIEYSRGNTFVCKGDEGIVVGPAPGDDRVAVDMGAGNGLCSFHARNHISKCQPPYERPHKLDSLDSLATRLENLSLLTETVSLVSHTHGRERRSQRNIERQELQAAIKHGNRERSNPGRDGSTRWRYTYNGVVYITDETSRHEITSWRIDDNIALPPAEVDLCGRGSHAVLIVDHSGSMRKDDVPGYSSRMQAVYDCLSRDFVEAQLNSGSAKDVVVSIIAMNDDASVLVDKYPLNSSLALHLNDLGKRYPCSHGNYLPALDKAFEIMLADSSNRANFLLLFLSDGLQGKIMISPKVQSGT
jgi:hypothetical protein